MTTEDQVYLKAVVASRTISLAVVAPALPLTPGHLVRLARQGRVHFISHTRRKAQIDWPEARLWFAVNRGVDINDLAKLRLQPVLAQILAQLCVFHAIADTHFTGSRTAFHGKADTVLR